MRIRPKLRGIIWPLFSIALVMGVLWIALLTTPLLTLVFRFSIESLTGTTAQVMNVRWNGWGNLHADSIVLIAPDWPGKTAEILRVENIQSEFKPLHLLIGHIVIESLDVEKSFFRVAQRDGFDGKPEFNLNAIKPRGSGLGIHFDFHPQEIRLEMLQFENYLVVGDTCTKNGDRAFRGSMHPILGGIPGEISFQLVEVEGADLQTQKSARDVTDGVKLEGQWNSVTFGYQMEANRVDFTQTVRPLLPAFMQQACDQLGVKGTVTDIQFKGTPEKPLQEARLVLESTAVDLPQIGLPVEWKRFSEGKMGRAKGVPRLALESGKIILNGDQLRLEAFSGRLLSVDRNDSKALVADVYPEEIGVALPLTFSLSLDFSKTPPPTTLADAQIWFRDALTHCGVHLEFGIPDFALIRSRKGNRWVTELPKLVVNILDNFKVQQGSIKLKGEATRAASAPETTPAELLVEGALQIHQGKGAYMNFNYPLENVEAAIKFKGDRLTVESFHARGSGNCQMQITGTVDGADDDAGVDLRVEALSPAPIDLALQNAFEPGPRKIFELLLARDLRDRLLLYKLLPANDPELGGTCTFDIRVQRARNGGSHVATTGTIDVRDARALCQRFPYPINVAQGHIVLEDESIKLPAGTWKFTTDSGGIGTIDGEVRIPRISQGRDAFPDLHIKVVGDLINPLLLAAIPLENWDTDPQSNTLWPGGQFSKAAQAIQALGMTGEVATSGTIGTNAKGHTTLDLGVFLQNGVMCPRDNAEHALQSSELLWPDGFDLDQVEAKAHLTEKVAELLSLRAIAGNGEVRATGSASLLQRDRWLHATLTNAPLGTWLTTLLPEDVQATAAEAWRISNANGTFDSDLMIQQSGDAPTLRKVNISTGGLRFEAAGKPCELRVTHGSFEINGPTLTLDDMQLEVCEEDQPAITLNAHGSMATTQQGKQDLECDWNIALLNSATLPLILRAANQPEIANLHERWNPVGDLAGTVHLGKGATHGADWRITARGGSNIAGDPGGTQVSMLLMPDAQAILSPGTLALRCESGACEDALVGFTSGGIFTMHGKMAIAASPHAQGGTMQLAFQVSPLDTRMLGVLPTSLREGLTMVDLHAAEASAHSLQLLGCTATEPRVGLQGDIFLHDASLNAGVRIENINGQFGINAREGRPFPVQIDLGGGAGTFSIRNRLLTEVGGTLRIPAENQPVQLRDVVGNLYGGRAWATANIGGAPRAWDVAVEFAGASMPGLVHGGTNANDLGDAGEVRAAFACGGVLDGSEPMRGVGQIQASDARIAEFPLTLQLLQATQFMPPLSGSLDSATVDFHLRGDDLRFDRFELHCPTLRIYGNGSLDLRDWNLALRFRSRGTLPFLSDLFGLASDQLFVIDVNGSVDDPQVKLIPLPPFGADPSTVPPREHSTTTLSQHP